jgi:uncharacterized protein (TIGR03435 family)
MQAVFSMALLSINVLAQGGHSENNSSNNRVIKFEVVSIRPSAKGQGPVHPVITPDGFTVTDTLFDLIEIAYNPMPPRYWNDKSKLHLPSWALEEQYSINARVPDEDLSAWQAQGDTLTDVVRGALQAALEDRCNLTVRVTPTLIPDLDLLVDKHGARLKEWKADEAKEIRGGTVLGNGFYYDADATRHYVGVSMKEFVRYLMRFSPDSLIQDKTGLDGRYDFDVPIYDKTDGSISDIGSPLDHVQIHDIGLTLRRGMGTSYIVDVKSIRRPDPN